MEVAYTNLKKIYKVASKSSLKAGKYLFKRFINNDMKIKINYKHDVKLDVDEDTEKLIINYIKTSFPHHGFICEEDCKETVEEANKWIIDPLDGSVNFSRGIPHFCTSIAYKYREKYMVGVVYDPIRREAFSAIRGVGAYLNGKPIVGHNVSKLEDAIVASGFFKAQTLGEGIKILQKVAQKVKKVRFFGSAALDLCYLACGRVNAYIQYSVKEWDIAAASLIAELMGNRIEIWENGSSLNVIAANNEIFDELKKIIS